MKQWTELRARQAFTIGWQGKKQAIVKEGDYFVVTSPAYNNINSVKIMRKKTARLNQGYDISLDQITTLFNIVN